MPMYRLLNEGRVIECLRCGAISHNPSDVANLYCGRCHCFLDQEAPYEHFIRLLSCVQACYTYTLGNCQMPLESLHALLRDTLEHVLGPDTLARWMQQKQLGKGAPHA